MIGQFTVLFGGSRILPSLWAFAGPVLLVAVGGAAGWALRTRRWLPAYGWAVAALIVILLWEFPWYLVWLLPIAALVRGWALRAAALFVSLVLLWGYTPHMFAPWPDRQSSGVVIKKHSR